MSVTTPTLLSDLLTCQKAKAIKPSVITIAKGAHFITEDIEIMTRFPDLDISIRGEPEEATIEIAKGKPWKNILGITFRNEKKIFRNDHRPFLMNMDDLP